MSCFPFFVKTTSFRCLLIGGGKIAYHKAELLLQAGVNLTLVARHIKPELQDLLDASPASVYCRDFEDEDIQQVDVIIAATADNALNTHIWQLAKTAGKWVNVVDDAEKCDFIFPALVKRGDLTVAISTSGVAPAVAGWLRNKFERELPQAWTGIIQALRTWQPTIRRQLPALIPRRQFYVALLERLLHTPSVDATTQSKLIQQQLQTFSEQDRSDMSGCVYLVGAGAGHPELISVRGQQLLQRADVVFYDRLVSDALLSYIRRDADKVFVGKEASHHHKTQADINQMMAEAAQTNKVVVRLKGGDPFVFGRGGEEMQYLEERGIEVDIVAGISAVNGIAASLGIPLTLRGVADKLLLTSVYVGQTHSVDWQHLAAPRQTLVLYMGLRNLSDIVQQLIAHGLPEDTPMAIVEKGTHSDQRTHFTKLSDCLKDLTQTPLNSFQSPVLTLCGEVVKHRKQRS